MASETVDVVVENVQDEGDLQSVIQALEHKHKDFERKIAELGVKVNQCVNAKLEKQQELDELPAYFLDQQKAEIVRLHTGIGHKMDQVARVNRNLEQLLEHEQTLLQKHELRTQLLKEVGALPSLIQDGCDTELAKLRKCVQDTRNSIADLERDIEEMRVEITVIEASIQPDAVSERKSQLLKALALIEHQRCQHVKQQEACWDQACVCEQLVRDVKARQQYESYAETHGLTYTTTDDLIATCDKHRQRHKPVILVDSNHIAVAAVGGDKNAIISSSESCGDDDDYATIVESEHWSDDEDTSEESHSNDELSVQCGHCHHRQQQQQQQAPKPQTYHRRIDDGWTQKMW